MRAAAASNSDQRTGPRSCACSPGTPGGLAGVGRLRDGPAGSRAYDASGAWLPPVMTLLPKVILRRGLASIYSSPSARSPFLERLKLEVDDVIFEVQTEGNDFILNDAED